MYTSFGHFRKNAGQMEGVQKRVNKQRSRKCQLQGKSETTGFAHFI